LLKTKAQIISDLLKGVVSLPLEEPAPFDEEATAALLQSLLPDVELVTCEDLCHLDVDCCEICHTFFPENELSVVEIPEGRTGWVCCSIKAALNPDRGSEPNPVMEAWLQWGRIN